MEAVATRNKHGQGNYDAGRWRLCDSYVKMSTKQLSENCKTEVPGSESRSRPLPDRNEGEADNV